MNPPPSATVPVAHVPAPAAPSAVGSGSVGRRPGPGTLLRSWAWGWLAIVQLVLDLLLAGPYLTLGFLVLAGVFAVSGMGFGLIMLVLTLPFATWAGAFERLRARAFLGVLIDRPRPPAPGTPLWRRALLDGRAWRATVHLTVIGLWGVVAGTATLALLCVALALACLPFYGERLPGGRLTLPGDITLVAAPWLWAVGAGAVLILPLVARGLVGVDIALGRALLGQAQHEQVAQLTQRVETLTHTREMTVDSVELERRRIERDLHDGPQQRLVAIAMDLGMAQAKLDTDPAGARELVAKAHTSAKEAIVEMRQVARGIHPPVLTDRGLDAALSALAARSPVPVTVRVDLPRRPSPTIEAIAYFCVSEALTNVAKHSGARAAVVEVGRDDGHVRVVVRDDGRGGADPAGGTGLTGLRQRLAAVDGRLEIHSPPSQGTVLTMMLPERAAPPPPADPRSTP